LSCGKVVAFSFQERSHLPSGFSRLFGVVEVAANASHGKEGSKAIDFFVQTQATSTT